MRALCRWPRRPLIATGHENAIFSWRRRWASDTTNHANHGGVLLVNHGYPPLYNAGSEIDTQNIALQLRQLPGWHSRVAVFSREEDVYAQDYRIRHTAGALDHSIPVALVNNPREASYMRFSCVGIDDAFRTMMRARRPKVVHFGHVNHLSTSLLRIAKDEFAASTVFTLHDWFLLCPRGQFLMVGPTRGGAPPYGLCSGQDNAKCATHCFACRFGNAESGDGPEIAYWSRFIETRMAAFRSMMNHVDAFSAPSRHLGERFLREGGVPPHKMHYIPYGFDLTRLGGRSRTSLSPVLDFVFGYIGRHAPAKGVDLLVRAAFTLVTEDASLLTKFKVLIFGRPNGANTASIQRLIAERVGAGVALGLDSERLQRLVEFRPEYENSEIVSEVFNNVDAIVVPSIWSENSPLVIHEAQQARVPVLTANVGGMAELVTEGVNGFVFTHRSAESLASAMQRALTDPVAAAELGRRGYLANADGNVPSIHAQTRTLTQLYDVLVGKQ